MKCKEGKVHPRTGHEGPEGEKRDGSTFQKVNICWCELKNIKMW
jgi:hypothetical protein